MEALPGLCSERFQTRRASNAEPDPRSFSYDRSSAEDGLSYRAIGIVRDLVANHHAGIRGPVVGDGEGTIRRHDVHVKVDQALTGDSSACSAHTVRRMACGTTEALVDMAVVLVPAGVFHDLPGQIMALGAEAIGAIHAHVGIGKEICDQRTWSDCLTEFVAALEDVGPFRSVRTVGAGAAKLAIVVAVVAIGAEDLRAHGASLCCAVEVEHVGQQAGLWKRAAAGVHHRMAGSSGGSKLRNEVERIAGRYRPHGKVSIDRLHLLARAAAVAAKAVVVLVDGRS